MGLHSKSGQETVRLVPSDVIFRSDGPVPAHMLASARAQGINMSFDPLQNGWVRTDATDDFDPLFARPGWPRKQAGGVLSFRPWVPADAPTFRALLNNPNVWTFLPTGFPGDITLDAASDLIALADDEALHIVRAICIDGVPVGQVRLEFREHESELSYWLGEPHWRKGIGQKAVSGFVRERFAADPRLDHMTARVKLGNTGSLRILEKAGFTREGQSNTAPDWMKLRCDRPS